MRNLLRPMMKGDIDACVDLVRESLGDKSAESAREVFIHEFAGSDGPDVFVRRIVAPMGKVSIAGVCGVYNEPPGHPKDYYGVGWFAVASRFRGLGIGRLLLDECERIAREAGGTHMFVWSDDDAVTFYELHGYKEADDFIEPRESNTLLVKSL